MIRKFNEEIDDIFGNGWEDEVEIEQEPKQYIYKLSIGKETVGYVVSPTREIAKLNALKEKIVLRIHLSILKADRVSVTKSPITHKKSAETNRWQSGKFDARPQISTYKKHTQEESYLLSIDKRKKIYEKDLELYNSIVDSYEKWKKIDLKRNEN